MPMTNSTPMILTLIGLMCDSAMKIMTVVGTRPELIRLAAVLNRLDATPGIDHVLVHTGQNWDHRLNGMFFEELGLRSPDHILQVDTSSLGATLGDLFRKIESVLELEKPDAFLVLGDTNSAISLIMAKRSMIPTYHMEAGNRCFDANVPEETNRRIIDHAADFNLVYTEHARRNLLAEGLETRRIVLTGSPLREVLDIYRGAIAESKILEDIGVSQGRYFVVSAHRQENVDYADRLELLMQSLNLIAETWSLPVHVSIHPRTRKRIWEFSVTAPHELVRFHEPFGFLDYNKLQLNSACVLSDSGTIAEESSILGFPAVTLRGAIERPEALDTGSILMVDLDPERVVGGVKFVMNRTGPVEVPIDYCVPNTSERVVNFILSTAMQHKFWSGLR
jgi:UDP-N-acetylglucosamine 2-epimerase (non-hydrolysing)